MGNRVHAPPAKLPDVLVGVGQIYGFGGGAHRRVVLRDHLDFLPCGGLEEPGPGVHAALPVLGGRQAGAVQFYHKKVEPVSIKIAVLGVPFSIFLFPIKFLLFYADINLIRKNVIARTVITFEIWKKPKGTIKLGTQWEGVI